jgi:protein-tyrosine phosphatase
MSALSNSAPQKRIMFVCTGNICRSPLAHGLFEHRSLEHDVKGRYHVESSGVTAYHVGENVDARMRQTAARRGVKLNHRSQLTQPSDIEAYDLIFAMDHSNYRALRGMAPPELREKIRYFREFDPEGDGDIEVPDPWYGGADGFERVFDIVDRTVANLISTLEEETT